MFTQLNISLFNTKIQNVFSEECGLFIPFGDNLYFEHKKSFTDISPLNELFNISFYDEFNELFYT